MTCIQITHPTDWSGSLLSRLFARLSEHVARRRSVAQTIAELTVLSDRDLADIGLHRGDIPAVARRALGR
ncbi:MAG: primosomal protein DnaI [Alphaproteobacteria bacterium HGW-Alphaproteobacteria-2]|nr:MAG: primosomal protein DnaI [Alphaproteobacteria bacterium HGW-Alphaproteobacteria-2]